MSRLVAAFKTSICPPAVSAAFRRSLITNAVVALLGLASTANRVAPGSSSCNSPSCFGPSAPVMEMTPVTLPPGRLRLATSPTLTGSTPVLKTTGIVVVAALAASDPCALPGVAMTATRRRTKSAASSGNRSYSFCAQRYSIATLWPFRYRRSTSPAFIGLYGHGDGSG